MRLTFFPLLSLSLVIALTACSPSFRPSAAPVANKIAGDLTCPSFKSTLWTELYRLAEEGKGFPDAVSLENELIDRLLAQHPEVRNEQAVRELARASAGLYWSLISGVETKDKREIVKDLVAYELGDEETSEKARVQASVKASLKQIADLVDASGLECQKNDAGNGPVDPPPAIGPTANEGALLDGWKAEKSPGVYGMWKTIATAYQSCDAVDEKPLDASTPDVKGISEMNRQPASGGKWRQITDLASFLRSHPYLSDYRAPSSDPSVCFNVLKKPLIYDFGGKPDYTTSPQTLSLFSENGSGATNQLGIDCSGLVVTAHLTSGLKLTSTEPHRPQYVDAVPARNFMIPDGDMKKLDCFTYVPVASDEPLKPGDLLASRTHIVMIDTVGDDPFGIASIREKSKCATSNIVPSRYRFTLAHSSTVKGAIGINRIQASHYLSDEENSMTAAIKQYAVAACKAKFGERSTPKPNEARIVRHSGSSKCLDKVIPLVKSSCLKSCPRSRAAL